MTTIADTTAAATFEHKDMIVAALTAAGKTEVTHLYRYAGGGLLEIPMRPAALGALLTLLHSKDGNIDPANADHQTAIADLMAELTDKVPIAAHSSTSAASTTSSNENRKLDALAASKYAKLGETLFRRIRAADQLPGKIIQRMTDDLDRGTLSAECYTLTGLHSSLDSDEEKKTKLSDGVTLSTLNESKIFFSRGADVIMKIDQFCDGLLTAGFRPVTKNAANPTAGTRGKYGHLEIEDPADATKKKLVPFWFTPDFTEQYRAAARTGLRSMTPSELVTAHSALRVKIVDGLHDSMNGDSAGFDVLSRHSFTTVPVSHSSSSNTDLTRAISTLEASNATLTKKLASLEAESRKRTRLEFDGASTASGASSQLSSASAFADDISTRCRAGGLCIGFQKGTCKNKKCKFTHKCLKCGAAAHGLSACDA